MSLKNIRNRERALLYLLMPYHFTSSAFRRYDSTMGQLQRAVKNWHEVLLVYLGARRSATAVFRNGMQVKVGKNDLGRLVSLAELANIPEGTRKRLKLRIEGEKASLAINGKTLRLDLEVAGPVALEMQTGEHSMMDVRGRDVVDIGAYVDDTAIYYAVSGGAKHVYAFEPFPYLYETAVRNVKANGLEKRISTYNLAVSGETGNVSLNSRYTSFGIVNSKESKSGRKGVRVVSLDSIVKSLRIRHGALKVDCEGCEYQVFKQASSATLKSFDLIHVEYHYGYVDVIERLRREGFKVEYTKPTYAFRGMGAEPMLKGDIIASRKM